MSAAPIMRATILGSGSSSGVPRPVFGWGACDPNNPRNARTRCSLLVERFGAGGVTRVLVDTSPDLRQQLLANPVDRLDGVLITHDHADQTHGIDDLRSFALAQRERIKVYLDRRTAGAVPERFRYCFEQAPGSGYPAILTELPMAAGAAFAVDGPGGPIPVLPFLVDHGSVPALGFRFGGLAYSPDLHDIPDASRAALAGLDCWILDALRPAPHPSHFNLETALAWVSRVECRRAVLTNMASEMDYATLARTLPPQVQPAYDGMQIEFM